MRTPRPRTPDLPPWGKTECGECAGPVRLVRLADGTDLEVCMKPASTRDPRADVAAMVVGNRLHGYRVTKLQPLKPGHTLWIRHSVVCTVKPDAVQLALPTGENPRD